MTVDEVLALSSQYICQLPQRRQRLSLFRYYGGKISLIKHIINLIPDSCRIYVAAYAGSCPEFAIKARHPIEVINDIDSAIVAFYHSIQDHNVFNKLKHKLLWSCYSREVWELSMGVIKQSQKMPLENVAVSTYVAFRQGFAGRSDAWGYDRHRISGNILGAIHANLTNLALLDFWHQRLQGVIIRNVDALDLFDEFDSKHTCFYCDPPYIKETRQGHHRYRYEVDLEHHERLIQRLLKLKGSAILTSYYHPIHDVLLHAGWHCIKMDVVSFAVGRTKATLTNWDRSRHRRTEYIFWRHNSL